MQEKHLQKKFNGKTTSKKKMSQRFGQHLIFFDYLLIAKCSIFNTFRDTKTLK